MQTSKLNMKVSPDERKHPRCALSHRNRPIVTCWNCGEALSCLRWGCSIFFNAKKQQQHIHTLGWCCNLIYCIFLVFFYCNCIKPANISLLAFYILLVDLNKPLTRIVKLWVQNVKSCTVWSWLDLCQWNHLQLNCYEYLSKCPCILHKPYSHTLYFCMCFIV